MSGITWEFPKIRGTFKGVYRGYIGLRIQGLEFPKIRGILLIKGFCIVSIWRSILGSLFREISTCGIFARLTKHTVHLTGGRKLEARQPEALQGNVDP